MNAKGRPQWVGIAMRYPDGTVVAVEFDGDDLVAEPTMTIDRRDPFFGPSRVAVEGRNARVWAAGEEQARAPRRAAALEALPREIGP